MHSGKKLTLGVLPAVFVILAMLLAACGGSGSTTNSTTKAPASQQVFRFPEFVPDIATFDPALSTDAPSIQAIDMSFTGLVQLDNNLQVQPQLAQSYSQSSDGLTWTFHLKPNLKFGDGTPLTSKDVAYSIDRALQPATKSLTAPAYLNLVNHSDKLIAGKIKTIIGDSLKTPDDNTITITLNKKATYFLQALTYSCSYVVEKSLIDKYGTNFTDHLDAGGTSGPWNVQSYDHAKGITFVPNPNYYGAKPQLAKVIMPFYKDNITGYKAYKVGQIDESSVPSASIADARTLTKDFHQSPELTIFYIGLNFLTKPFDNIKIRQAFELALNKDVLSTTVWKKRYTATNHIVPQGMPGYNPNLKGPDGTTSTAGNPTMAKQLLQSGLQEEGYSSVSQLPTIIYSYESNSPDEANEVAAEAQQWQTVLGINVKTEAVDFNKLLDEEFASLNNPKGLQMFGAGWGADYPDPQDFLTLQFDKTSTNNNTNYGQNKVSDAADQQANQQAMEAADVNPDSASRLTQYQDAEQKLVTDVAWLPMFQRTQTHVLKPYVINFPFNAQTLIAPDAWGNIYIASH